MTPKTPEWWYSQDAQGAPWWAFLLLPLSGLWRFTGVLCRHITSPYRSRLTVISVGNVTVGGSGKTPITHEILRLLNQTDHQASGLSRGYGGNQSGPVLAKGLSAAEIGDEAALIAQDQPFFVARKRPDGLKAIEAAGFKVAVLDDAHQNPSLIKDISFIVIDGDTAQGRWPFGNGHIVPSGPLREPLAEGLKRADAFILWMRAPNAEPDPKLLQSLPDRPVFVARLSATKPETSQPVFGFAGIAKPWAFEQTLKSLELDLAGFVGFGDHQSLLPADIARLRAQAEAHSAHLITTEKDWIKLSPDDRRDIIFLPIRARFDAESKFLDFLKRKIKAP